MDGRAPRKSVSENNDKPVKLAWPGHLEKGVERKVEEELQRLNIKPGDERYCRVSLRIYFQRKFHRNFQTIITGCIETSTDASSGTDAKVQIAFTDDDGQVVGPLDIRENNGDTMEAGQKNVILIELLQKLNGIAKVQIKHVSPRLL